LIVSGRVHAEVIDNVLKYNNVSNDSSSAAMDAENQSSGGAKNSSSQSKTSA